MWDLWQRGQVEREIIGVRPLLASWNSKSDLAQISLQAYLDKVLAALSPLPDAQDLFLHIDIDVERSTRLLRGNDLENYLTPLFRGRYLPSSRFVLVSAHKRVGGGSRIVCGRAQLSVEADRENWRYFTMNAGSNISKQKERIYGALQASQLPTLMPGPASVRLAWCCSADRNWANLWKPTGDAMGPVLGSTHADKRFSPADDRIVNLEMHLNIDNTLGHDVIVGMWWRAA